MAKGVEIIEAETCPDHIHMLVSITISISFPSSVDAMSEIIALYLDCRFNVFFLESVNILK